jgi:hypothetical protein
VADIYIREVVELIRERCSVAAGSGKKTGGNVYRPYMCYTVMDGGVVLGGYIKLS